MTDQTNPCQKQDCNEPGDWRWWNGKGSFGPYCITHARDQLEDTHRCPITRSEDVSDGYVLPAGIIPHNDILPCVRTKTAFDTYLETDGEEPRQCRTSWCNNLLGECEMHD